MNGKPDHNPNRQPEATRPAAMSRLGEDVLSLLQPSPGSEFSTSAAETET